MVQEAVADGIGDGGLADQVIPLLGWVLTGDHGGGLFMSIFDDLQKVSAFGIR